MKGCFMFHGESVFQIRGALFLSGGVTPWEGHRFWCWGGGSKKIVRWGGHPLHHAPPLWEALDIRYYNAHDTSTVFFKN